MTSKMFINVLKIIVVTSSVTITMSSDICDENYVDNIYTRAMVRDREHDVWRSAIAIVRGDEEFLWHSDNHLIGKPIKSNPGIKTLTKVHIFDIPECDDCSSLDSLRHKTITFFYDNKNKKYSYIYKQKSLNEDIEEEDVSKDSMPLNIPTSGDPTDGSDHNLWPNGWINTTNPCVALDQTNGELVYILNPSIAFNNTRIMNIKLKVEKNTTNWGKIWTSVALDMNETFVGFFNYKVINLAQNRNISKIYAISIDKKTMSSKVYEYNKERHLMSTDMDFKALVGCRTGPKSNTMFITIIVFIVALIVVTVLVILLYLVYKVVIVPNTSSKLKSKKELSSQASMRSDTQSETQSLFTIKTVNSDTGKAI